MSAHAGGLDHRALLYGDDDELVSVGAAHLRAGVERGDAAVAVIGGPGAPALRDALGDAAEGVRFLEPGLLYRTPVEALGRWTQEVAAHRDAGGRLRVLSDVLIGEPPAGGAREWARAEALFGVALERAPVDMLCAYDVRLGEDVLAGARSTHRCLRERGGPMAASASYGDPLTFLRGLDAAPLPPPPDDARELRFDHEPAAARRFAAEHARMAGLSGERLDDARVAVTEIANNAVIHGRPPHILRTWRHLGRLLFEIEDAGGGIQSPLTGFLEPRLEATGGRGVWIARRLCDLVEVRGARVRLHLVL